MCIYMIQVQRKWMLHAYIEMCEFYRLSPFTHDFLIEPLFILIPLVKKKSLLGTSNYQLSRTPELITEDGGHCISLVQRTKGRSGSDWEMGDSSLTQTGNPELSNLSKIIKSAIFLVILTLLTGDLHREVACVSSHLGLGSIFPPRI